MKIVFLMLLGLTALMADFVKKGDVVHDSVSGLMWQDNSVVESREVLHGEAITHCTKLSLAGHDDWRLPTVHELQSIVDLTRYNPAIQRGFHYVASESYWSSTPYADDKVRAWNVDFKSGSTQNSRHSYDFYVRCVR